MTEQLIGSFIEFRKGLLSLGLKPQEPTPGMCEWAHILKFSETLAIQAWECCGEVVLQVTNPEDYEAQTSLYRGTDWKKALRIIPHLVAACTESTAPETPEFLDMLRVMVKSPGFDIRKNYLEARRGERMRHFGVEMSTEWISHQGKISDEQWREGWDQMRAEGLIE